MYNIIYGSLKRKKPIARKQRISALAVNGDMRDTACAPTRSAVMPPYSRVKGSEERDIA